MTYSIFNRDSGNLIESFTNGRSAIAFVAEMLEDPENDPDSIGLVITDRGRTIQTLTGYEVGERVGAGQALTA